MKVYDAKEVTVVFAGLLIDAGFADGEFVRIEQAEEDYTAKAGADGEVVRSKTNNGITNVKIILLQSSAGNDKLSVLRNLDLASPNGAGVGTLMIKDRQGTSVFVAPEAWIAGPPAVAYGKEAGTREWPITCASNVRHDGGN